MKITWPAKDGQPACTVEAEVRNEEPTNWEAEMRKAIDMLRSGYVCFSSVCDPMDWSDHHDMVELAPVGEPIH